MQMLKIAMAMMLRPVLIVLDEPSRGLGPKIVEEMYDALIKLNEEEGISLMVAEQQVHRALRVSSRSYLLENGRIVMEAPSRDFLNLEYVKEKYLTAVPK